MVDHWLSAAQRAASSSPYETWDVTELPSATLRSAEAFAPILLDHLIDREFLSRAAAIMPASSRRRFIETRLPNRQILKRGAFGEVLSATVLEQFHDHVVPVKKLRYRTASHDSPKATDVLAVKQDTDGQITSLAYVEVKFRTTRRDMDLLAVTAHDQLHKDCAAEFPAVVGFVVEVLSQSGASLADAFLRYLRDRRALQIDTHHIFFVMEREVWDDGDLNCLDEHESLLDPLTIHIVRISELPQKVSRIYDLLNIGVMDDDE